MKNRKNQAGFTLLELLVVIAIVGILASLAVGRYRSHVVESNRNNARTVLLLAQQAMEREFLQSSSYSAGLSTQAQRDAASQALGLVPANRSHILNAPVVTQSTYTLSISPLANQPDLDCGTLSITNTGLKGATGTAGALACWP